MALPTGIKTGEGTVVRVNDQVVHTISWFSVMVLRRINATTRLDIVWPVGIRPNFPNLKIFKMGMTFLFGIGSGSVQIPRDPVIPMLHVEIVGGSAWKNMVSKMR